MAPTSSPHRRAAAEATASRSRDSPRSTPSAPRAGTCSSQRSKATSPPRSSSRRHRLRQPVPAHRHLVALLELRAGRASASAPRGLAERSAAPRARAGGVSAATAPPARPTGARPGAGRPRMADLARPLDRLPRLGLDVPRDPRRRRDRSRRSSAPAPASASRARRCSRSSPGGAAPPCCAPGARQLLACLAVGTLLMGANAVVSVAEVDVPSSMAALLIASVPLWVILYRRALGDRVAGAQRRRRARRLRRRRAAAAARQADRRRVDPRSPHVRRGRGDVGRRIGRVAAPVAAARPLRLGRAGRCSWEAESVC